MTAVSSFMDKVHEENYRKLAVTFPQVETESDYRSAAYIIALPEIFAHVGELACLDWPFAWCYDYETVEVSEADEWDFSEGGRYYFRKYEGPEPGEMPENQRFAALSGGSRYLALAGMSLFNDANHFNLGDITGMDDRLFKVFVRACQIRRGAKL